MEKTDANSQNYIYHINGPIGIEALNADCVMFISSNVFPLKYGYRSFMVVPCDISIGIVCQGKRYIVFSETINHHLVQMIEENVDPDDVDGMYRMCQHIATTFGVRYKYGGGRDYGLVLKMITPIITHRNVSKIYVKDPYTRYLLTGIAVNTPVCYSKKKLDEYVNGKLKEKCIELHDLSEVGAPTISDLVLTYYNTTTLTALHKTSSVLLWMSRGSDIGTGSNDVLRHFKLPSEKNVDNDWFTQLDKRRLTGLVMTSMAKMLSLQVLAANSLKKLTEAMTEHGGLMDIICDKIAGNKIDKDRDEVLKTYLENFDK